MDNIFYWTIFIAGIDVGKLLGISFLPQVSDHAPSLSETQLYSSQCNQLANEGIAACIVELCQLPKNCNFESWAFTEGLTHMQRLRWSPARQTLCKAKLNRRSTWTQACVSLFKDDPNTVCKDYINWDLQNAIWKEFSKEVTISSQENIFFTPSKLL